MHLSLNTFVGNPQELLYFMERCGADAVHLTKVRIRPYYGISGGAVLPYGGHGVFGLSDTARTLLRRLPHVKCVTFLNANQQDRDAILFAAKLMFNYNHPVELRVELSQALR